MYVGRVSQGFKRLQSMADSMLEVRTIGSLVVGLVCLGYTYYCLVNGGTHSRYEGWKTKEEAPNTFRFSMILYTVIGLASLSNLAYSIFLS